MSVHYPKLQVRVPSKGIAVLTTVLIDGEQWPVTRVAFDTGADLDGLVSVRLEFHAEIDFESEVPLAVTSVALPANKARYSRDIGTVTKVRPGDSPK